MPLYVPGLYVLVPFLKLTLDVGPADPEPLEDALFAAGATAVTLTDAADHPILEPGPGSTPLWPEVRVEALFPDTAESTRVIKLLGEMLGQLPGYEFSLLEDRVWEREWLKDFRPMRFGEKLWVCPGGMRPSPPDPAHIIVELDPGLAFGTGTHPTTALCLEWLDGATVAGTDVLDFGCGSGILAIAALKLGARAAFAVDIDPQALAAARDNAARNDVLSALAVASAEIDLPHTDIVLANILAEPLISLAERIASRVRPRGRLVLSGILANQAETVAARYAKWFDMAPATVRDGWARLDGVRR